MKVRRSAGVTMLELLIVVVILGVVAVLSTSYLLGQREKRLLMSQRDQMITVLKEAQNKSMVAEDGYAYRVEFADADGDSTTMEEYVICSDVSCQGRKYQVHQSIELNSPFKVEFAKLTGAVSGLQALEVSSNNFKSSVRIEPQGVIEVGEVTRK